MEDRLDKAIEALELYSDAARIGDGTTCICNTDIVKDAVHYMKAFKQVAWERDVAVSQLESIGKGLGEKMDDVKALLGRFDRDCEACKISFDE